MITALLQFADDAVAMIFCCERARQNHAMRVIVPLILRLDHKMITGHRHK